MNKFSETMTINDYKVLPITTYQNALGYTNEEMATRCNLTTERFGDLLKNPDSMTVKELYDIALGIEINVESLLTTTLHKNLKYVGVLGFGEENIKRIVNKKNVKELVRYINNNSLKYQNGYKLVVNNSEEEISEELAKEICELLLGNGEIRSFLKFAGRDNILDIKSLDELDKYPETIREAILLGIDYKWDKPCINLPKYYFDLLNDLSEADQELVLTKTLTRAERIINFTDYDFTKVEKKSGILELVMLRQNELRGNNNDF